MTLTAFARRVIDTDTAPAPTSAPAPGAGVPAPAPAARAAADTGRAASASRPDSRSVGREADGLAVASFVLGLVGLLVFNLLLGPTAIVMALLALARRTRRRGRAFLGLALGVADLAVLAVLVTANGAAAWSFGG